MAEATLPPLAAEARRLTLAGEWQAACEKLRQLISEVTGVQALDIVINQDQYSLNSLNGRVALADGRSLFFKYHHEEGEDQTITEYYRATLLRNHGFSVDVPLYACGEPGRQILLYSLRDDRRLADVCYEIEAGRGDNTMASVVAAQQEADNAILAHTLPTLQSGTTADVEAEAIHQLFWHRLVSPGKPTGLGGRVAQFYVDQTFQLGEMSLTWNQLCHLHWRINGVNYAHSLRDLFLEAGQVLAPAALAHHGVVVAHGDAHNANVWYDTTGLSPRLVSFDPAFAGASIPALLAEIKATFHNIFAHPCWLYEPQEAARRYQVAVRVDGDTLVVDHNWSLTPLRAAFLTSKGDHYWQPLLAALRARGSLPDNWQRIVRLGLFCCPTLVMNLRGGENSQHNPVSSALGLAVAVMLGSGGNDAFSQWLNGLLQEA